MTLKGNKDIQEVYHAIESNQWVRDPDQDPLFANTILFMSSVGNNGANNNVYLDSSTNNFTITRNGDTYQGSNSPFNPNGWSVYLDGTGDFLNVADDASIRLTNSNFTIECWFNEFGVVAAGAPHLWQINGNTGAWAAARVFLTPSTRTIGLLMTTDAVNWQVNVESTATYNRNQWNHLALVRNGTSIKMYLNGIVIIDTTFSGTFMAGTLNYIGNLQFSASTWTFNGYISNFRILKGTALYTSNFIPASAPLTAVANTSLLTCQTNGFVDKSTNNLTITRNGDAKILPFSPFRMDTYYNANSHGGSAYFDGTGDYLTVANNSAFIPSNSDFTYEVWVYPTATPAIYNSIFYKRATNGYAGVGVSVKNTGFFSVLATSADGVWNILNDESSIAVTLNAWQHIAITREGSSWKVFKDGVLRITATSSATVRDTGSNQAIGAGSATGDQPFSGYISNFRFVKGTALYTGNFTPPSAPVITSGTSTIYASNANVNTTFSSSNTSLLCNFTNAGIIDVTGKNNIYTVGATQVSTSVYKDSKSFYFDGSGYYYFTDDVQYMYARPITIDAWVYPTTSGTTRTLLEENTGGDNGEQFIGLTSSNVFYFEQRSSHGYPVGGASTIGLATTATVNSNTWTHVAIVFSTTGVRMYVNGVLSGSNAGVRYWNNAARKLNMGINGYALGNYIGYVEDLRITLGERYTSNFTPSKFKRY